MLCTDAMVILNNTQLSARMRIVRPIFQAREVLGRSQMRGRARGPTLHNAMTIKVFPKYHLVLLSLGRGWDGMARNSPQCLHFIASS